MNRRPLLFTAAAAVVVGAPVLGAAYVAGRSSARSALAAARAQARTDALTGLVNRAGLERELARRAAGRQPYAVLLIDLDGFKAVNDRWGHAGGDELLIEVGHRLSGLVAGAGVAARLGGDEFVVVAGSPAGPLSVLLAHEVTRAVARPVVVQGRPVTVRASVGVVHGWAGDAPDRLLHAADMAMYRAKAAGGGVVEHDGDLVPVPTRPVLRTRELAAEARTLTGAAAA
jgi:diguanylate cyclase (GGDEF)-like protein